MFYYFCHSSCLSGKSGACVTLGGCFVTAVVSGFWSGIDASNISSLLIT